jgi:hypothetical protein
MFAVEIAVIVIVVVGGLFIVEISPYLSSSKPNAQIGMYNQKQFGSATIALSPGETAIARFNYSTYDPAILVLDLTFPTWKTAGDLSIYINGNFATTINAPPDNKQYSLTLLSFSGQDWVKSPSLNSFTYGNEITFVSKSGNGYDGTFSYKISIRGSR